MYLLKCCGCSIQFEFLSVCRWLQYSCRSFWFSISSFHCKGNSVSFFSRHTEMGSCIWCSGGIIKWLIVERLIFANGGVWCACWQKKILFCWVDFFFLLRLRKIKRQLKEKMPMYCIFLCFNNLRVDILCVSWMICEELSSTGVHEQMIDGL